MRVRPPTTEQPGKRQVASFTAVHGISWGCDCRLYRVGSNVAIEGATTFSGDRELRIVYRIMNDDREAHGNRVVIVRDPWVLDPSQDGVFTTPNRVAGYVDGIAPAAGEDELIWAFMDPYATDGNEFVEFGLTQRFRLDGVTIQADGTRGSTSIVNVPTGEEARVPIGARVLLREGVSGSSYSGAVHTPGADYNQGTVSAKADGELTVDLDSDYGYTTNNNADLPTDPTELEIIQMSKFEPRAPDSADVYGGYSWCYIGMIQLNASAGVGHIRRPGDLYRFTQNYVPFNGTGIVASTNYDMPLARWMPRFRHGAEMRGFLQRTVAGLGSSGLTLLAFAGTSANIRLAQNPAGVLDWTSSDNNVALDSAFSAMRAEVLVGLGSTNWALLELAGYYENDF